VHVTSGKLLLASALLIFCVAPALAQRTRGATTSAEQQASSPQPTSQNNSKDVPLDSADIAITANVTAKELRFEVVPNPTVEFPGKPQSDTQWDALRENLPRPVEPGVTYRNIGIRLKIVSRFADIERIVAEALGETPVTDSISPKEGEAPKQNTQPPVSTPQPNGGQPK
jgi:hypothetical protein